MAGFILAILILLPTMALLPQIANSMLHNPIVVAAHHTGIVPSVVLNENIGHFANTHIYNLPKFHGASNANEIAMRQHGLKPSEVAKHVEEFKKRIENPAWTFEGPSSAESGGATNGKGAAVGAAKMHDGQFANFKAGGKKEEEKKGGWTRPLVNSILYPLAMSAPLWNKLRRGKNNNNANAEINHGEEQQQKEEKVDGEEEEKEIKIAREENGEKGEIARLEEEAEKNGTDEEERRGPKEEKMVAKIEGSQKNAQEGENGAGKEEEKYAKLGNKKERAAWASMLEMPFGQTVNEKIATFQGFQHFFQMGLSKSDPRSAFLMEDLLAKTEKHLAQLRAEHGGALHVSIEWEIQIFVRIQMFLQIAVKFPYAKRFFHSVLGDIEKHLVKTRGERETMLGEKRKLLQNLNSAQHGVDANLDEQKWLEKQIAQLDKEIGEFENYKKWTENTINQVYGQIHDDLIKHYVNNAIGDVANALGQIPVNERTMPIVNELAGAKMIMENAVSNQFKSQDDLMDEINTLLKKLGEEKNGKN